MDPKSRYAHVGTLTRTFTGADGSKTTVAYFARRFLPRYEADARILLRARPGERLDQVAARLTGDPLQFHRICDAQRAALNPYEFIRDARDRIPVPSPMPDIPAMPLGGKR